MCETRFHICRHCGNLMGMIHDAGVPVFCCGEKMELMEPNTTEAAGEKHLPVVCADGDVVHVNVGTAAHPMTGEHSIQWIYLQTDRGGQRKCLLPGQPPEAAFALAGETPVAAYAYCNLHGLWKTEIGSR